MGLSFTSLWYTELTIWLRRNYLPCLHKELFAHNSNRKTWWCDVLHLLYIIPYQSHTCSNWQSNNADLLSGFPFLGLLCHFGTQFSTQNVPSNLTLNTCEACQFFEHSDCFKEFSFLNWKQYTVIDRGPFAPIMSPTKIVAIESLTN